MSTEQKQRASVSQWQAINRLLEFIIVSSYDGEEPGGLRGREKGTASLSAGFTSLLASAVTSISVSLLLICLFHREISEPSINHVYEWTNEWKIIQNTRNCDSVMIYWTVVWFISYHASISSIWKVMRAFFFPPRRGMPSTIVECHSAQDQQQNVSNCS